MSFGLWLTPDRPFTGEYITVKWFEHSPSRKTSKWLVTSNSSGGHLGVIKWYGSWRQYAFFPDPDTIWNKGCLDDINKCLDTLSQLHQSKGDVRVGQQ